MSQPQLRMYLDADVLYRAATASHPHTAALVILGLSELPLLDAMTSFYALDEATRNLTEKLDSHEAVQNLLSLVAETVRITEEPPEELLFRYSSMADPKDVLNLAAAIHAQTHLLVTFNVRDYAPDSRLLRVLTPGDLVVACRGALLAIAAT